MTRTRRGAFGLMLAAALLSLPALAFAQGVIVALTPAAQEVAPGAELEVDITLTDAGSPVNGFHAVIGWDPAALTFLPQAPLSLQEGSLMTEACAERFHRFGQGASADTITDVLLCAGVSVTGPGQLYRLHFRASTTPQATAVTFLPGLQFYEDGLFVPLAYAGNAGVGIGMPPVVGAEAPLASDRLELRAAPNPARGGTVFTIATGRAGPQRLRIADLRGRVVRRFDDADFPAGARTVAWDGRDAAGRLLPGGIYFVTLETRERSVSTRIVLIP